MNKLLIFASGMCAAGALQAAYDGNAWMVLWLACVCGVDLWLASNP